jgi:hypothetical protein
MTVELASRDKMLSAPALLRVGVTVVPAFTQGIVAHLSPPDEGGGLHFEESRWNPKRGGIQ